MQQKRTHPEYAWGAEQIGEEIGRTAPQVYHLHETGFFGDAVVKAGHRRLLGFRSKLRNLGAQIAAKNATTTKTSE